MPYHVYVIALDPAFATTSKARRSNPGYRPGKGCYYVGYTSKLPERRYIQHLAAGRSKKGHNLSSRVVFKYGIYPNGLRPQFYESHNPISTKRKAIEMEEALARKLRIQGHCVWQK
ncbi:MAG: hypothetical protein R3275_05000 [Saprospiraceae bacterium]|nr:hypothetical protein [Saprospiraceae bacterium]